MAGSWWQPGLSGGGGRSGLDIRMLEEAGNLGLHRLREKDTRPVLRKTSVSWSSKAPG